MKKSNRPKVISEKGYEYLKRIAAHDNLNEMDVIATAGFIAALKLKNGEHK